LRWIHGFEGSPQRSTSDRPSVDRLLGTRTLGRAHDFDMAFAPAARPTRKTLTQLVSCIQRPKPQALDPSAMGTTLDLTSGTQHSTPDLDLLFCPWPQHKSGSMQKSTLRHARPRRWGRVLDPLAKGPLSSRSAQDPFCNPLGPVHISAPPPQQVLIH
jgi:hypothetical protein